MRERRSNALSEPSAVKHQSEGKPPQSSFRERLALEEAVFIGRRRMKNAMAAIPETFLREDIPGFPELGELEVLRHFTRLSHRNFAIETQFYPLGSCTMKYNPKVNEVVARLPGFAQIHPLAPVEFLQGAMKLLYDLERMLIEISGMDSISLQPSAGAQGELTGLMLIRACLTEKGNPRGKDYRPGHGPRNQPCELDALRLRCRANFFHGTRHDRSRRRLQRRWTRMSPP